jgi:hypothetical protein
MRKSKTKNAMAVGFQPIRIVGLDVEKTKQSPTASDLRLMYLELSDSPPAEWIQLFNNQRQFPQQGWHSGSRRAEVEGQYIVVDCVPEEMEQHHRDLKKDVAVTNDGYQKFLDRQEAQTKHEAEAQRTERERIEGVKSRLSFD